MRQAGVLLHISSLPSEYGIGSLGKAAYDFVDFLQKSGQKVWQILPIGPTSYGDSPYQALSAFAFNPYFIDLEFLVRDGLLASEDLPKKEVVKRVDYANLFYTRYKILHKAFLNRAKVQADFDKFVLENDSWLNDYAMFMVIKNDQDNRGWEDWCFDEFKYRNPNSLQTLCEEYSEELLEWKFIQYLFYYQWNDLHKYANSKGVSIMGDIPIYCAYDSVDVWAHPEFFQLDNNLKPVSVAGCPPDQFSEDGQLWGNPLYDYKRMKEDNYSWWVARVQHSLKMFDILRIDHFRGFAGYYSIPYGDTTAKGGHWEVGPGYDLFKTIEGVVGKAPIVAENLGFLTPDVQELLEACGYPGMNIMQFELSDGEGNVPLKGNYGTNNIIYTGTHDNQMLMSFYNELKHEDKLMLDSLCKIKFTDKPNLKLIEYAMKKDCDYCIVPLQDYLGLLDYEGRVNIPSTAAGNWTYVSNVYDYTDGLSEYMYKLAVKTKRYTE